MCQRTQSKCSLLISKQIPAGDQLGERVMCYYSSVAPTELIERLEKRIIDELLRQMSHRLMMPGLIC